MILWQDLCTNDKIEQKDKTLLEHLSRRLKYKRGGKHGVCHTSHHSHSRTTCKVGIAVLLVLYVAW